jgi:glycosyltransferase involved in cell wall biosynthesis
VFHLRPDLTWVVPEARGGIRAYAEMLWPEVQSAARRRGISVAPPIFSESVREVEARLHAQPPRLVHLQHEFGLFGRKAPLLYRFPEWRQAIYRAAPDARLVATAHTVVARSHRYETRGTGWQRPLRFAANVTVAPLLSGLWRESTWGPLDGVIVHSGRQVEEVRASGCKRVEEIPHFVPVPRPSSGTLSASLADLPTDRPLVLVFGYFTPQKGQDVVIRSFARMRTPAYLVLGGGLRRAEDQAYFDRVQALIDELGLRDRCRVTGFLPDADLTEAYSRATLVVAPFRETSGSGSLAHALGQGGAILASDLPLNREIAERVRGALDFFPSENPEGCAAALDRLLGDEPARQRLRAAARIYAEKFGPRPIAEHHVEFYAPLLRSPA